MHKHISELDLFIVFSMVDSGFIATIVHTRRYWTMPL